MIPFTDVLAEYGCPYYLKVDVEGYDGIILEQLAQTSHRPRYLSAENGPPEILECMIGMGYDAFKWIDQRQFADGASGPFGDDAPGPWLTASAVLELIRDYYDHGRNRDAVKWGWYDLHARHAA